MKNGDRGLDSEQERPKLHPQIVKPFQNRLLLLGLPLDWKSCLHLPLVFDSPPEFQQWVQTGLHILWMRTGLKIIQDPRLSKKFGGTAPPQGQVGLLVCNCLGIKFSRMGCCVFPKTEWSQFNWRSTSGPGTQGSIALSRRSIPMSSCPKPELL